MAQQSTDALLWAGTGCVRCRALVRSCWLQMAKLLCCWCGGAVGFRWPNCCVVGVELLASDGQTVVLLVSSDQTRWAGMGAGGGALR
eukprot:1195857-Prorocentrum_minimum.AAC.6